MSFRPGFLADTILVSQLTSSWSPSLQNRPLFSGWLSTVKESAVAFLVIIVGSSDTGFARNKKSLAPLMLLFNDNHAAFDDKVDKLLTSSELRYMGLFFRFDRF
jgi:hypothetical protein